MRSIRYLNTILTVLALLLSLQLWTTWAGSPAMASQVQAARRSSKTAADGIPNAGSQRKQMIDLLKKQTQKTEELVILLKSGKVRVKVAATPAKNNG